MMYTKIKFLLNVNPIFKIREMRNSNNGSGDQIRSLQQDLEDMAVWKDKVCRHL